MKLRPVNKEEIKQKARMFFRDQKWKDFLVFLVFVGIASIFWLMQYSQQTRETDMATFIQSIDQRPTAAMDSLREKGKEISVRINGTLSPASGYRFVDSIRIDPATVWV